MKLQAQRDAKAAEEVKEVRPSPQINRHSKELARTLVDMEVWIHCHRVCVYASTLSLSKDARIPTYAFGRLSYLHTYLPI